MRWTEEDLELFNKMFRELFNKMFRETVEPYTSGPFAELVVQRMREWDRGLPLDEKYGPDLFVRNDWKFMEETLLAGLEEMPPLINDKIFVRRTIALWRLKIGK